MSLIGIKFTVADDYTALQVPSRLILYRHKKPTDQLSSDRIKDHIRDIIKEIDIWWGGRPYIRLTIDIDAEAEFIKQMGVTRTPRRDSSKFVFWDLSTITGEPPSRFEKAKDLNVFFSRVYIVEDLFQYGVFIPTVA